jgi:hypothetical protein
MSKATELKDGHENVNNGSPEKRIGDTDIGGNEGEESDDYEEIDDEVCVQGNASTSGSLNHI